MVVNRMKCWHCGGLVIWKQDFTYEEYGYEEMDGVVSVLECSNQKCQTEYEIRKPDLGYIFGGNNYTY